MDSDTNNNLHIFTFLNSTEILGTININMSREKDMVISRDLSNKERENTINILEDALKSGYDSCVVTRTGNYATKHL